MALIKMQRDRSWPHPVADEESDDGTHRRVSVRGGLGSRASDKRLCEAANRILGGLEHPNVTHALKVERDDDERLVLVYPHDALEPLGPCLGTRGPDFLTHVLVEICRALDAAHGLGVIHGALTPAAVRIQPGTDTPEVRVCDFGLGHLFGSAATLEERVEWLPYSPEKLLGLEPTPAEDVYLLGLIGYGLLTGRPVFRGGTHQQVLRKHAMESPVDLVASLTCEPWLGDILSRCLQKEPEDRYLGPLEVADALRTGRPTPKAAPKPKAPAASAPSVPPPPKVPELRVVPPAPPTPPNGLPIPKPKGAASAPPPPPGLPIPKPKADAPLPAAPHGPSIEDPPSGENVHIDPVELDAEDASGDAEPSTPSVAAPEHRPQAQGRRGGLHPGLIAAAALVVLGLGTWALLPDDAEPDETVAADLDAAAAAVASATPEPEMAAPEPLEASDEPPASAPVEDTDGGGEALALAEVEDEETDGDAEEAAAEPAVVEIVEDDEGPTEEDAEADDQAGDAKPSEPSMSPEQRRAEAQRLCDEARSAQRSGRTTEAIKLYRRALAVRGNHAAAAHALGTIYFNRRDYRSAIRYERRAVSASPRRAAYQLALGDYYFKSGNDSSAKRHWEKAASLGSTQADKRLSAG